jgi:hypothetical protein
MHENNTNISNFDSNFENNQILAQRQFSDSSRILLKCLKDGVSSILLRSPKINLIIPHLIPFFKELPNLLKPELFMSL